MKFGALIVFVVVCGLALGFVGGAPSQSRQGPTVKYVSREDMPKVMCDKQDDEDREHCEQMVARAIEEEERGYDEERQEAPELE